MNTREKLKDIDIDAGLELMVDSYEKTLMLLSHLDTLMDVNNRLLTKNNQLLKTDHQQYLLNYQQIEANMAAKETLQKITLGLLEASELCQHNIQLLTSEMKGLQIEHRRILTHLFGSTFNKLD